MAVKDVRGSGGEIPEPGGDPSETPPKGVIDPVAKIQQAIYDGERLKQFKKAAGIKDDEQPPVAQSPFDIKAIDVTQLITSSQAMLKDAYEKALALQNKDMLTYLGGISEKLKQVEALQAAAIATPKTQKSELDTYREVRGLMDEVAGDLKKNMGVQTTVSASDVPGLLSLKKLDLDREERQREHEEKMKLMGQQHEEKMTEQKHQWQKEDRQFEKTFALDKAKLETEGGFKSRATNAFEDVAGAVVDSITKAKGGEAKSTFETECPDCGAKLTVKKGQKEAKCPKCGVTHEVTW